MIEEETFRPENEEPKSLLLTNGIFMFMGDVTIATMKPLIDWILSENLKNNRQKELTLGICSPGGDLNACFALIDVMKGSKIPIKTVGLGMIASCGLLMFITGTKEKEFSHPILLFYPINIHGVKVLKRSTNYLPELKNLN